MGGAIQVLPSAAGGLSFTVVSLYWIEPCESGNGDAAVGLCLVELPDKCAWKRVGIVHTTLLLPCSRPRCNEEASQFRAKV